MHGLKSLSIKANFLLAQMEADSRVFSREEKAIQSQISLTLSRDGWENISSLHH